MLADLDIIQTEGLATLATISDETSLENFRVAYLGKKGKLTAVAAGMRGVSEAKNATRVE